MQTQTSGMHLNEYGVSIDADGDPVWPSDLASQAEGLAILLRWADPLASDGNVAFHEDVRVLSLDGVIAKRFMAGACGKSALLLAQQPEINWISRLPISAFCLDRSGGRVIMVCDFVSPLQSMYIVLPADRPDKMALWRDKGEVRVRLLDLPRSAVAMGLYREDNASAMEGDLVFPLRQFEGGMKIDPMGRMKVRR